MRIDYQMRAVRSIWCSGLVSSRTSMCGRREPPSTAGIADLSPQHRPSPLRKCSETLSLDNDPILHQRKQTGVMRPGQTRRPYGRNNGNNPYRYRQQIPHGSQTLDSNGPNVKIRGTAHQIFERYVALSREASTSGDRVAAENLYQHAEHYFRVMNAASEGHQQRATRSTASADLQAEMAEEERLEVAGLAPAASMDRQPQSS